MRKPAFFICKKTHNCIRSVGPLTSFSGCTYLFVSSLVENPENRFIYNEVQKEVINENILGNHSFYIRNFIYSAKIDVPLIGFLNRSDIPSKI